MGDGLQRVWSDVVGNQPAPDTGAIWLSALLAAAVVLFPATWGVARHVVTIAHEGAHGVAAMLTGRRLGGIRLHADGSGLTISKGRTRGPGVVVMYAAGYIGPALVGLAAAYLLHSGHALGVLWLSVLLLTLLLLQIRNFYGLYAVLVAGALVFVVSWWGSGSVQSLAAPAPGSCCSPHRRPCWSCSTSAAAAGGARPTPTCWPGSPGCPAWSGSASSCSSTSPPCCSAVAGSWSRSPDLCSGLGVVREVRQRSGCVRRTPRAGRARSRRRQG